MKESHVTAMISRIQPETKVVRNPGIGELLGFIEARRLASGEPAKDMEKFEEELHGLFVAAEREVLSEELARLDIDAPAVEVDGIVYKQVERCEETYFSAVGPIRVNRGLYSTRVPGERAICPMELRGGIVEGRWTPLAAKQATWVVAHLTPGEGEELFKRLGNMTPSKSSLDRLPKQLSHEWEEQREKFEEALRREEIIPKEAVALAVSLDGVMLRIEDPAKEEKTTMKGSEANRDAGAIAEERAEEKDPKESETNKAPKSKSRVTEKPWVDDGEGKRNPYHEASCGTVALYDREGEVLSVTRLARMPEKGKATLKSMLLAEVCAIMAVRPDLEVVALADGAKDNWTFLSKELPSVLPNGKKTVEVLDFFHGAEHIEEALTAYYGKASKKRSVQFEKLRHILRHNEGGSESVIRSLRHMSDEKPQNKVLKRELKYFRRNRKRMQYASLKTKNLPIGTGIQEAACKTLVVQRARRSGICWGSTGAGGQAILTFRSFAQSNRFDRAWDILRQTYVSEVIVPNVTNVIPITRPHCRVID